MSLNTQNLSGVDNTNLNKFIWSWAIILTNCVLVLHSTVNKCVRCDLRAFEFFWKFYLYFNIFCSLSTEHSGSKSPKTDTCNSSFDCSKETSQEAMEKEFWQKLFSKCTFIIVSRTCNKSLRLKSQLCEKFIGFPVLSGSQIWLLVLFL